MDIPIIFPGVPKKFETNQWIFPNLALVQLGTVLKMSGYRPIIINIPQNELLEVNYKFSFDDVSKYSIICISAYSFQLDVVRNFIKKIKSKDNIIIIGGALASTSPEEALEYCGADFAIEGEGDVALPKLVDFITKDTGELNSIENLWYKKNGKLKFTFKSYIKDLDSLPIIDFKIQNFREMYSKIYKKVSYAYFPLESSRGCYANCTFCSSKQIMGNWRKKSAERLIEELRLLKETYPGLFKLKNFGISYIDNTATANSRRILKFAKLKQEEGIEVPWSCMSRINEYKSENKEVLIEMAKSNNFVIFFGIEAGYNKGLLKINKKIDVQQIENTIKLCLQCNIPILDLSFIVGFPWESEIEIERTIDFAKKMKMLAPLRIKVNINYFILFKRTAIYEELRKEYENTLDFDKLNSRELIDRHWNKNVSKFEIIKKINEFNEFNKQFELTRPN